MHHCIFSHSSKTDEWILSNNKQGQNICFKLIPYMCKLVVQSVFYEELSIPTPIPEMLIFHHLAVQNWSETQNSPMLFSWEHQKYQNLHPGAHFGTSIRGSWGGCRVPPCSCSITSVLVNKIMCVLDLAIFGGGGWWSDDPPKPSWLRA